MKKALVILIMLLAVSSAFGEEKVEKTLPQLVCTAKVEQEKTDTLKKEVVSVRYFNMAGQEMQEVNGMTIVVITYTDGTASAAKVIKPTEEESKKHKQFRELLERTD